MAINPKARYPANINVADAGYPYGKARNTNTPGDGSGTPWEADLANDILGFQQALLQSVGVVPSGTPERVGASQYLTAIQALINKLKTSVNVWTKEQTFQSTITLGENTVQYLTGEGQIFYQAGPGVGATYPIRKVLVPLTPTFADGWVYSAPLGSTAPGWGCITDGAWQLQLGRNSLPSGALLRGVRVGISSAVNVELRVRQGTYDTSIASPGVAGTVYRDSYKGTGTLLDYMRSVVFPPLALAHNNDSNLLQIAIDPASGAYGCAIRWIELSYYDTLLTNA